TVEWRHLALPLPDYEKLDDFGACNDAFLREAPPLAARAVTLALERAGLTGEDVDLVVSATVTGVAAPSLDARLVPLLGLRSDVKRMPLVGLGCVAGAAGIARVADYLDGHPDDVAVLVSAELWSLTLQRDDTSMANVVASGLFGDGAAAVVMAGHDRASSLARKAVEVRDSVAHFFPDTERVMGWDVGASGMRVVLSPVVPDLVANDLRPVVDRFLAQHHLAVGDIKYWIAHPGGPKVLTALEGAMGIDATATAVTWASLREVGNLSSASVLHVLEQTLDARPAGSGEPALLVAMGPGFCAELVLLRW
ncbi:MAG TPA: 3-oxoacyl-[acyl-carrier-protein] synthase III C-terminal domain-containing protein, partial [Actinomycetes bacterium]|nr:3-oxoacyl-[acyl-carrier-protein] synthase III C-terminal domain-containing protein [Actinomycetes bacterium]